MAGFGDPLGWVIAKFRRDGSVVLEVIEGGARGATFVLFVGDLHLHDTTFSDFECNAIGATNRSGAEQTITCQRLIAKGGTKTSRNNRTASCAGMPLTCQGGESSVRSR